jgi:hypothetical protein
VAVRAYAAYGRHLRLLRRAGSVCQAAPEQCLCWWETGSVCERRYRVGEQWHNLRPDALAEFRAGSQPFRFWLEWDRGTMKGRDLGVKFRSYAHYLAPREWAREQTALPKLFVVAPEIAQERRIHRVAQASLANISGLIIWTTTAGCCESRGRPLLSGLQALSYPVKQDN